MSGRKGRCYIWKKKKKTSDASSFRRHKQLSCPKGNWLLGQHDTKLVVPGGATEVGAQMQGVLPFHCLFHYAPSLDRALGEPDALSLGLGEWWHIAYLLMAAPWFFSRWGSSHMYMPPRKQAMTWTEKKSDAFPYLILSLSIYGAASGDRTVLGLSRFIICHPRRGIIGTSYDHCHFGKTYLTHLPERAMNPNLVIFFPLKVKETYPQRPWVLEQGSLYQWEILQH